MEEASRRRSDEAAARMREKIAKQEIEAKLFTDAYSARIGLPVTWLGCIEGYMPGSNTTPDYRYHRFQLEDIVIIGVVPRDPDVTTPSSVSTSAAYVELDCRKCGCPARSRQPLNLDLFKDREALVDALSKVLGEETDCWRRCDYRESEY